jgi:hypothetical protein
MSEGTVGTGWKAMNRRERPPMMMLVVVVETDVVGDVLVDVVDVVGVTPDGPAGDLVSQALRAKRRSPATICLRIAFALSDRLSCPSSRPHSLDT